LTTSVAADFPFTPEQAGDVVLAYDNNSPDPLTDDMAADGMLSATACQNGTGDSETCGAGLCTHVQATYRQLKGIADCADVNLEDKEKIKNARVSWETLRIFLRPWQHSADVRAKQLVDYTHLLTALISGSDILLMKVSHARGQH
jgi:hypothetical protein